MSHSKQGGKNSVINITLDKWQNQMHPQTYTIGECAICLDEIDEGEVVTTECKHTFHPSCFMDLDLRRLSGITTTCPLCRKDVSSECNQLREAFRIAFEVQKTVYKQEINITEK